MTSKLLPKIVCLSVVAFALAACGGSSTGQMRVSSPFTAQDAPLFDDAVEFVSDPESLTGQWAADWDRDLRGRAQRSDLVVLVSIPTLQTQTDPQQHTTYRLTTSVQDTFKGKAPPDLSLSVSEDAPGYATIEPGRARLNSEKFIAFVKYYERPDQAVSAHWHLSIWSPQVQKRLDQELDRAAPPSQTVIESVDKE